MKLPELTYAPVQDRAAPLAKVDEAQRQAFGVVAEGLRAFGQEQVKTEAQGAALKVQTGLAQLEEELAKRRYWTADEVKERLGEDVAKLDLDTQARLDRGEQLESWAVGGALYGARGRQLVREASEGMATGRGWKADFQEAALKEVEAAKGRYRLQQAQAFIADQQATQEAHWEQMVRLRQFEDALKAIDRSGVHSPGQKMAATEKVLKQKQAWDEQNGAIRIAEQAFADGVKPGSKVLDEAQMRARLDFYGEYEQQPLEVREAARKLLDQRIKDADESHKNETAQVFAVALQAFNAPGADGKPRESTAFVPANVRAYLTDPANGVEAAELWDKLLAQEKSAKAADRALANQPTPANWEAFGILTKDMNDSPSKYRTMDPARFTSEVYGKVGPLMGQVMDHYKSSSAQPSMDPRVLTEAERKDILASLPEKYKPSNVTKPTAQHGKLWSLLLERIGQRKQLEWADKKGPVPSALLQQWVAEEMATGSVEGGRYFGLVNLGGVPKAVAEAEHPGKKFTPDKPKTGRPNGPPAGGTPAPAGAPANRIRRTDPATGETRVWNGTAWVKE